MFFINIEGGTLGTVLRNFDYGQPALQRLEYHHYNSSQILEPPSEKPITVIESVEEQQKDWLGLRNSTKL